MRTFLVVATLASLCVFGQTSNAQVPVQSTKADRRSPNKNTVSMNYGAPFMYEGTGYWDAFPAMLSCKDISTKRECRAEIRIAAWAPVWYDDVDFQGYSFEFPGMTITGATVSNTTLDDFEGDRLSYANGRLFVNMADLWMQHDPFQDSITITVTFQRVFAERNVAAVEVEKKQLQLQLDQ